MKRTIISIIALSLLCCACLTSCSIPHGGSSGGGSANSPSVTTPSDTTTPSSDTSVTDSEYALKLGDAGLNKLSYVTNGTFSKIGFLVEGLKPNTTYEMHWSINQAFMIQTNAYFSFGEFDGLQKAMIFFANDYVANTGLGIQYTSTTGSIGPLLNGNQGEGIEVTTAGEGAVCFLILFESSYENSEQMNALCKTLLPFVTELTFTEVVN